MKQRTLICYFHLITIILLASSLIIGTVVANTTTATTTTTSATITTATTKTDINKSKTDQELTTIGNYIDDDDNNNSNDDEQSSTEQTLTTSITSLWPFTLMAKYFGYNNDEKNNSNGESEGFTSRTFGRIKKLQMSLLPIMFKLGVMTTIIFLILFLTAKSVFIGLTLLVINLGFIIAKLVALKIDHGHGGGGGWGQQQWPTSSQGHANDVHVHIHNSGPSHEKEHYHEPYGAYSHHSEPSSSPGIYIEGNGGGSSPWSTRGYGGNNRRQNRILYPTIENTSYERINQQ